MRPKTGVALSGSPRTTPVGRDGRADTMGRVFAVSAFVEAGTWAGLLIGMYLKYVAKTTEVGVQVFGMLHGCAFILYVGVTIVAALVLRWRLGTVVLALVAAVPPLMTVPLELWMRRTGRLRSRDGLPRDSSPAGRGSDGEPNPGQLF